MKFLITTPIDPKRTPEHYITPDEIVAGPNFNKVIKDGVLQFFGMPTDICDMPHILNGIPDGQKPDLVVVHYDPFYKWSMEKFPPNPPRVLIVSGTHFGARPIASLVEYILKNQFAAIIVWQKQHVHFLKEAGFKNVYWMPGLLMSVPMRFVRPYDGPREDRIAFAYVPDQFHVRRNRMVKALKDSGLPFVGKPMTRADGLECLGRSLIAFNSSLNGDFNMRVFEATSMGAMLLTDRLSVQSGLGNFYKEGESVVTYENEEDLLEKARYYLDHPEEASAIGARGKAVYEEHFSQKARAGVFLKLLRGAPPAPFYAAADEPRTRMRPAQTNEERHGLGHRILVYEWMQDIHRREEAPTVDVLSLVSPHLLSDLSDFKRLSIHLRQPLSAQAEMVGKMLAPLNVSIKVDETPLAGATLLVTDPDSLDRPEVSALIAQGAYQGVFFGELPVEKRAALESRMASLGMGTNGSAQTFYLRKAAAPSNEPAVN